MVLLSVELLIKDLDHLVLVLRERERECDTRTSRRDLRIVLVLSLVSLPPFSLSLSTLSSLY